jgi:pimeloyl-ACP methyl ester carboxylesterase
VTTDAEAEAWSGTEPPPAEPRFSLTRPTPSGEVRVHVWAARDGGSRRPVLFCLHGWTESGRCFGPLAAALGRRWTVVAPDAPGHGGTPWSRTSRYRVADHADAAVHLLDQLPEVAGHRSDVVVLGHDLGGLTAARLAAERPGVVRYLVLEEPARAALRRTRSAASVRARIDTLQGLDRPALLAAARAERPAWPADELGPWADDVAAVSLDALAVPVAWGEPLVALLADVACPVTLVHGSIASGGSVSSVAARRCAAACRRGCEIVQLDAGPSPRREDREPFIAVLAAALGRSERL